MSKAHGKRFRPTIAAPKPVDAGPTCEIIFGANAGIRQVLMQLNVLTDRLYFSPEQADHVAAQLTEKAMLARGGKAS